MARLIQSIRSACGYHVAKVYRDATCILVRLESFGKQVEGMNKEFSSKEPALQYAADSVQRLQTLTRSYSVHAVFNDMHNSIQCDVDVTSLAYHGLQEKAPAMIGTKWEASLLQECLQEWAARWVTAAELVRIDVKACKPFVNV
jgi:hypothetical protein